MTATLYNDGPTGNKGGLGFALPDSFWDRFVAEHWEQWPLRLSSPFDERLIEPHDLFRAMVAAGERWVAGDSVGLSFHVEHGMMQANVGARLPRSTDRDLEGWSRRIDGELADYMLGCAPLQRFDRGAWLRAIEFLSGLYARVGLPGKFAELEVFLGRYRRTPFGTHRDTASNFMFVVSGSKRLALWPAEYFRDRKHPSWIFETIDDADRSLDDAVILEGSPGDVLYWPSSWWHTAISDGRELSAAVAIALLLNAPDRRLAEDLLRASSPGGVELRTLPFARSVPAELDRSAALFERARAATAAHWLRRYTGFGFETVPPLELDARAPSEASLSPLARLAWHREEHKTKVAVFGHLFELDHHPELEALLGSLERGERVRSGSPLLDHLAQAGALVSGARSG